MKSKIVLKNITVNLTLQIITAIYAVIYRRLFTETYGSEMNGLIASINAFMFYIGLVESGIGSAGVISLYKPLAEKNYSSVSRVITAAKILYRQSGIAFVLLVGILTILYPTFVTMNSMDKFFVQIVIILLSFNGIIEYFFLGKYKMLLVADQKTYITAILQIGNVLFTLIVSVILIKMAVSPAIVIGSAIMGNLLKTILTIIYVKKTYPYLNIKSDPDKVAFSKKNSILLHQIAGMISNNTDIVLLMFFVKGNSLVLISIYSIYSMILRNVLNVLEGISGSLTASFGQFMAISNSTDIEKRFRQLEWMFLIIIFTVFIGMGTLIYPFIYLYTMSFNDSNLYIDVNNMILFVLVGFLQGVRMPSNIIQLAAGHIKELEKAAITEASINLIVSLSLVSHFGITGVMIGTFCSHLYRTCYNIWYTNKNILYQSSKKSIVLIVRNIIISVIIVQVCVPIVIANVTSFIGWVISAVVVTVIGFVVLYSMNSMIDSKNTIDLSKNPFSVFKR